MDTPNTSAEQIAGQEAQDPLENNRRRLIEYDEDIDKLNDAIQLLETDQALYYPIKERFGESITAPQAREMRDRMEKEAIVLVVESFPAEVAEYFSLIDMPKVIKMCDEYDFDTNQGYDLRQMLSKMAYVEQIRNQIANGEFSDTRDWRYVYNVYQGLYGFRYEIISELLKSEPAAEEVLITEEDLIEQRKVTEIVDSFVEQYNNDDEMLGFYRFNWDRMRDFHHHVSFELGTGNVGYLLHGGEKNERNREYQINPLLIRAIKAYSQNLRRTIDNIHDINPDKKIKVPQIEGYEEIESDGLEVQRDFINGTLNLAPEVFFDELMGIKLEREADPATRSEFPDDLGEIGGLYYGVEQSISAFYNTMREFDAKHFVNPEVMRLIILHEVGHHVHSRILSVDLLREWHAIHLNEQTDVTGYVYYTRTRRDEKAYAAEDFAEAFQMFLLRPYELSVISKARYQFMDKIFRLYGTTEFQQANEGRIMKYRERRELARYSPEKVLEVHRLEIEDEEERIASFGTS